MAASKRDYLALRNEHVARGVAPAHPLVIDHAKGSHLWDDSGKEYIDFVGGIGVMNLGHSHPKIIAAVQKQLERLQHTAFQVATYDVYVELAERLNKLVGKGEAYKSAFVSTGAEAVENAVKVARAYRNAPGIIAFRGAFHGRTQMGMALTGMSAPYKQNFGPLSTEVYHTPYPDEYRGVSADDAIRELEYLLETDTTPDRVAAVIIECVQGDGGFLYAGTDFLQKLRALTKKHGIVLICDEIQAGFGRTGKMFGFENAGIQPDVVTVAKSLAGGFPLSGVIGRKEIMDAPTPGGLGGTYGGSPTACAAALAVLDIFEEEKILDKAVALGEQLQAGVRKLADKYEQIGIVRGLGPMVAMEFVKNKDPFQPDGDMPNKIMAAARELGLLIIKCGYYEHNAVRLLAPLTTSSEDAAKGLELLDQAIAKAVAQ